MITSHHTWHGPVEKDRWNEVRWYGDPPTTKLPIGVPPANIVSNVVSCRI
jgi:hypothetical protein